MNHLIRLSGHRESEIGVVFSGLRLEGESYRQKDQIKEY